MENDRNINKLIRNLLILNMFVWVIRIIPSIQTLYLKTGPEKKFMGDSIIQYTNITTLYAIFFILVILVGIMISYDIKSKALIALSVLQLLDMFLGNTSPFLFLEKIIKLPISSFDDIFVSVVIISVSIVYLIMDAKNYNRR